jgi:hypothetical protein
MPFKLRSQSEKPIDTYRRNMQPFYSSVDTMEAGVNRALGNPVGKASSSREKYTNKNKGNWVDSDKMGHAAGGMYTRKGISAKLGGGVVGNAIGVVGSNLLGVAHEVGGFNSDHGIVSGVVEAGKDIVNNFIGSLSSEKNLEKNIEKYGTSGMSAATRKERMTEMKGESPLQKQRLSPLAAKKKAARDLAYAKSDDRRTKKAHSQRMHRKNPGNKGKDYDHEDGRFESVKQNRGNEGEGTKKESGKNYKIKD